MDGDLLRKLNEFLLFAEEDRDIVMKAYHNGFDIEMMRKGVEEAFKQQRIDMENLNTNKMRDSIDVIEYDAFQDEDILYNIQIGDIVDIKIYDICEGKAKVLAVGEENIQIEMLKNSYTMCYSNSHLENEVMTLKWNDIAEIQICDGKDKTFVKDVEKMNDSSTFNLNAQIKYAENVRNSKPRTLKLNRHNDKER